MNENPYCSCSWEHDVRIPHPWCPMPNHQLPDPPVGIKGDEPDDRDWDDDE